MEDDSSSSSAAAAVPSLRGSARAAPPPPPSSTLGSQRGVHAYARAVVRRTGETLHAQPRDDYDNGYRYARGQAAAQAAAAVKDAHKDRHVTELHVRVAVTPNTVLATHDVEAAGLARGGPRHVFGDVDCEWDVALPPGARFRGDAHARGRMDLRLTCPATLAQLPVELKYVRASYLKFVAPHAQRNEFQQQYAVDHNSRAATRPGSGGPFGVALANVAQRYTLHPDALWRAVQTWDVSYPAADDEDDATARRPTVGAVAAHAGAAQLAAYAAGMLADEYEADGAPVEQRGLLLVLVGAALLVGEVWRYRWPGPDADERHPADASQLAAVEAVREARFTLHLGSQQMSEEYFAGAPALPPELPDSDSDSDSDSDDDDAGEDSVDASGLTREFAGLSVRAAPRRRRRRVRVAPAVPAAPAEEEGE